MGKKWSLKIVSIKKVAQANPQVSAQNPTNPAPLTNVNNQASPQVFGKPGQLYVTGEGDTPLFKRALNGKEQKALLMHEITPEKVLSSIQKSLSRSGFDPKRTNYSQKELVFFKNQLEKDLLSEYNDILNLLNPQVFKS